MGICIGMMTRTQWGGEYFLTTATNCCAQIAIFAALGILATKRTAESQWQMMALMLDLLIFVCGACAGMVSKKLRLEQEE